MSHIIGMTVYAWVYEAEYSFDGIDVKMENASHISRAVTFDTSGDSDSLQPFYVS